MTVLPMRSQLLPLRFTTQHAGNAHAFVFPMYNSLIDRLERARDGEIILELDSDDLICERFEKPVVSVCDMRTI